MRFSGNPLAHPVALAALSLLTASALAAQSKPLPLKYVGPPTVPSITSGDLMTRLYKFADDSMMGRDVGSIYHLKGAAYIEGELRRMGLKPGGTNGSFYQDFPLWGIQMDRTSNITVSGKTIPAGKNFVAQPGLPIDWKDVPMIFYGSPMDTSMVLDSAQAAGKIIVGATFPAGTPLELAESYRRSSAYRSYAAAQKVAKGRILLIGDEIPPDLLSLATDTALANEEPNLGTAVGQVYVATAAVETIYGMPMSAVKRGAISAPANIKAGFSVAKRALPGRNVIAIMQGSDPLLRNQYVAIGAHSDHIGFAPLDGPEEHDSLKVLNRTATPAGQEGGRDLDANPITSEEWKRVNAEIAAIRSVYPPRPDSISNGADDDGSGTVSVLEIAEAFAKGALKPKRSIIFVWHAGEEHGMWGSSFFMDNPTVPRDSIVAQLNIDMVGRGAPTDVTGQAKGPVDGAGNVTGPGADLHGGNRYLQLVGSRRLSTELGDMVESVNTDGKHGFAFDYHIDADGHQQDIYCRSDHWSYAKWGIPIVFFTTGGHADYHQVTDEPQYIRYDHMAAVDSLIFDIATKVANLDHKVKVDKPKPNPAPAQVCKQ